MLDLLGPSITPPTFGDAGNVAVGLPKLISNVLNLALIIGGILTMLNFIMGGYEYMIASGDPKKLENAWSRIWQSLIGLVIITASMALISIFEKLFGIDIRTPIIYGPGT